MKSLYSRRNFIGEAGVKLAGIGTAMALSGTNITTANAAQMSTMAGSEINPVEFGQSLKGIGFNLLVSNVKATVDFSRDILLAEVIMADDGFAILKKGDFLWMLHGDQTYHSNPLAGLVAGIDGRGRGIELRLYNQDPDETEKQAKSAGYKVLAASANKPHGLRECYILDPDGYCWVISRALHEGES